LSGLLVRTRREGRIAVWRNVNLLTGAFLEVEFGMVGVERLDVWWVDRTSNEIRRPSTILL